MTNTVIPSVEVLVSTYNGESYLKEQLKSILWQKDVDLHCLVRDDGSKDNTVQILEQYENNYAGKFHYIKGENVGFFKSFYKLVEQSGDFDFYAFSDQDDLWDMAKLTKCIDKLNLQAKVPEMCFCNSLLVDSDLNPIRLLFTKKDILPNEKHSRVLECLTSGCTIVFNKSAIDAFLKGNQEVLTIHDFWLYVVCSYLGHVFYEPEPLIQYRQHNNNVIGSKNDLRSIWKMRFKQIKKITHMREELAGELIRCFSDTMSDYEIKRLLPIRDYRKNLRDRLRLLFYKAYKMPSLRKTFWFKVHVLLGNV